MTREDRGKNIGARFTDDLISYVGPGLRPWSPRFVRKVIREMYAHPGLFAVAVYRYGQWVQFRCRVPVVRQFCKVFYHCLFSWVRTHLQIELPPEAAIDGGLRIYHFGGIIVNGDLIAGRNLGLNSQVVIGSQNGVPRFGDSVSIKVGAKVFGDITLGNHVTVGAGAVVTKSFPNYAIVAGVPAKLLRLDEPSIPEEPAALPAPSSPDILMTNGVHP